MAELSYATLGNFILLREGLKKKLVGNSTKRGGGSASDFPLRKKKHGLKTLDFA